MSILPGAPGPEERPAEPAPAGVAEPPGGSAVGAAEAAQDPLRQRPADGGEKHHLDPAGAEPPREGQNVWTQRDKAHMMPPGGQALGHQAHGVLRAPHANGEVRRVLGKKQYVHQYLEFEARGSAREAAGVEPDSRCFAKRAARGRAGDGRADLPARDPARRHQPGAEHPALAPRHLLAAGRVPRGLPLARPAPRGSARRACQDAALRAGARRAWATSSTRTAGRRAAGLLTGRRGRAVAAGLAAATAANLPAVMGYKAALRDARPARRRSRRRRGCWSR